MFEETFLDTSRRERSAVLRDLFDGQISPPAAAPKLAAITLPRPPPDQDDDEDEAEEALAHIEGLWNNILDSLEEAPEHVKTVCDLIVCMSQLEPALTVSGKQFCDSDPLQRVWEDTPRLGFSLRDEWSSLEAPREGAEIKRFAVANALIGHLMLYDEQQFDHRLLALWTMRDALEYPLPCTTDRNQHRRSVCSIPAAVRLVEIAGQLIVRWNHEFKQDSLSAPGGGGPVWKGKHNFCKERWQLWQRRFVELGNADWLEEESRSGARKAADVMSRVE